MAEPAAAPAPAKKSDLGVRTASAVVMLAVAGTALWLGGWYFRAFVVAVGVGVLWEWWGLVARMTPGALARTLWLAGGATYIGLACYQLRDSANAIMPVLIAIGTDVGAYFAGRLIGGPKIAPSISPSKTWAGLAGGIVGALSMLFALAATALTFPHDFAVSAEFAIILPLGAAALAVIAQAGDFFESWMKRRAGVKDSGALIPGHGGLFDRVDGLLPVAIVAPFALKLLFGGARF